MVATRAVRRQRSSRAPFLPPCWQDNHPEFVRLDAALPAEHHARWLAGVVTHLDIEPLRRSYANRGSQAYLPQLLLAFVLFMYAKGVLSPAEWARRARYDDQCKWLLRGLLPSRSRLYAFRDRLEPFLDDWHRQLLAWAILEGLTSAKRGSLDGSFVAALASRHQLMGVRRVERRLLLLRLLVWLEGAAAQADLATRLADLPELLLGSALLWLALLGSGVAAPSLEETLVGLLAVVELLNPEETLHWPLRVPAWVPQSVAGRQRVLRRYEDAQQRLRRKLLVYQDKKELSQKDQETIKRLKVSLTDPEAALGFDKTGTYRPLYNVPLLQDTESSLTLGWAVLARNNDDGLLKPMVEKTAVQLGQALQEVLADGAFVSIADLLWCEQQGITVYAPSGQAEGAKAEGEKAEENKTEQPKAAGEKAERDEAANSQGEPAVAADRPATPGGVAAGQQKKFAKGAFRYDGVEKVYYCPAGKRLPEAYRTSETRQSGVALPVIVHRASGQDCSGCAQQQRCTSNPAKGRVVKRYQGEETLERLQQRMKEPASRQVYKLRKQSVELGYADLKQHRGLRVFRCFGRKRARTQAGLVILASNGLKICAALQRRRAEQAHAPPEKQPA